MTQHEHTIMLAHHLPQTGSRLTAGHQGDAGHAVVDGPQKISAPIIGMYHKRLRHMGWLIYGRVSKRGFVTGNGQVCREDRYATAKALGFPSMGKIQPNTLAPRT